MKSKLIIFLLIVGMLMQNIQNVYSASFEIGAPKTLGTMDAYGVVEYQNHLYVAARDAGVRIFNISDPENPIENTVAIDSTLKGKTYDKQGSIYIDEGYLYVAMDLPRALRKFSLANPQTPVLVATFLGSNATDMFVKGQYLYTSNGSARIQIYNNDTSQVTDPLKDIGYYKNMFISAVSTVAYNGDILYAAINDGVYAFNISDPSKLSPDATWVSLTGTPGAYYVSHKNVTSAKFNRIFVSNGYLYCNDTGNKKLYKIDISNPVNLTDDTKWQSQQLDFNNNAIFMENGIAYIGETGNSNITNNKAIIIDVIKNPFVINASGIVGSNCVALTKVGNYLYAVTKDKLISLPINSYDVSIKSMSTPYETLPIVLEGTSMGATNIAIEISNSSLPNPFKTTVTTDGSGNWSYIIDDIYNGEYTAKVKLLKDNVEKAIDEELFTVSKPTQGNPPTKINLQQNETDATSVEASVAIAHETKTVTCTGKIPMKTRIGFKEVSVSLKTPTGTEVLSDSTLSLGNYSFSFILPQPYIENQNYSLVISCEDEVDVIKTFKYFGQETVAGILRAIKNSTIGTIEQILKDNDEILMLEMGESSLYGAILDKNAVLAKICGKDFSDTAELYESFNLEVAEQAEIEDVLSDIKSIQTVELLKMKILEKANVLGVNFEIEPYKDLSDAEKTKIFTEIFNNKGTCTLASIQKIFKYEDLVVRLANTTGWSSLNVLYTKYQAKLSITNTYLNKYTNMTDKNKSIVDKTMARTSEDVFKNISEINPAFEKAVDSIPSVVPNGGSPSGGTTGGKTISSSGTGLGVAEPIKLPESPEVFADLEIVPWAKSSILTLAEKGIINGKGDKLFAPNDNVTKEEFSKMLIVALEIEITDEKCEFIDLEYGQWYYKYVATANKIGLVNGIDETTFSLGKPLNREQMATMIYRLMKYKNLNLKEKYQVNYADNISDYAYESVMAVSKAGIMNGVGANIFDAKGTATRAMAAKVIAETLQN